MSKCECGCGQETKGGDFAPGHDQKVRAALEARVGGLLNLRTLVDAAESYATGSGTTEGLTQDVRSVFSAAWRSKE